VVARARAELLLTLSRFVMCTLVGLGPMPSTSALAQDGSLEGSATVADGWHPWYELKIDPDDAMRWIVCGSKWDSQANSLVGVVYVTSDFGVTWRLALEDRNSSWVSEQSCAFGRNHKAYFISEASRVIDGRAHHDLGTTRVYASTDGGDSWLETATTAWADHATSAVNRISGEFHTLYNARHVLGMLVFSEDGRALTGPVFEPTTRERAYGANYPHDAIGLASGSIVALVWSMASNNKEGDLRLVRTAPSSPLNLMSTVISHTTLDKDCPGFDHGSLAYDAPRNRLFVLYGDGCTRRRLTLAWSDDEGATWSHGVPLVVAKNREVVEPSLVVSAQGVLGILWEEGLPPSGRWLFAEIRDRETILPPTILSQGSNKLNLSNDALLWSARQEEEKEQEVADNNTRPKGALGIQRGIALKISSGVNEIWRISGAAVVDRGIAVIWPTNNKAGMRLQSAVLGSEPSANGLMCERKVESGPGERQVDVTDKAILLYGGTQQIDQQTATLKTCVVLGNRSDREWRPPMVLQASGIESSVGTISILNALNGLKGVGAIWDLGQSVPGGGLSPGTNSHPFCLLFHLEIPRGNTLPADAIDIMKLRLKVSANQGGGRPKLCGVAANEHVSLACGPVYQNFPRALGLASDECRGGRP
jgi:hypothetical protein